VLSAVLIALYWANKKGRFANVLSSRWKPRLLSQYNEESTALDEDLLEAREEAKEMDDSEIAKSLTKDDFFDPRT